MFSVIIPTYNSQATLRRSMMSVLTQEYKKLELIVVDNGSTDNSRKIVESIIEEHPSHEIKYLFQQNTGSPAGSRNTGIDRAKNEWVCFLDSDDYWLPSKLDEVRKSIKYVNALVVAVAHWEFIEIKNKKLVVKKLGLNSSQNQYKNLLFNGNCYSTSTISVRRSALKAIGGFNTSKRFFGVEDYKLWLDLTKRGQISTIKKPLSIFSLHENNFSNNLKSLYENQKALVASEINENFKNRPDLLRKHLSIVDYYYGRALQKKGDRGAIAVLWNSIKKYPFYWKKIASLVLIFLNIKL